MKSYLCLEKDREVVKLDSHLSKGGERTALYFVLEAENWEEVNDKVKDLGAKAIRVLTKEEAASKKEDGLYDIKV